MSLPVSADRAGVLAPPPLLFLACAAGGAGLHFLHPIPLADRVLTASLGGVVSLAAGALAAWAIWTFKAAGTTVRPGEPVSVIVADGPYRFTRNPMYLSLCLLQVSLGLFLDGLAPLLFLAPLVLFLHFGVIRREERYLEAKFGAEYLELKRRVRRWI